MTARGLAPPAAPHSQKSRTLGGQRPLGDQKARTLAPAAAPEEDWGGLPGAVQASKCGAINNQIVKTADAIHASAALPRTSR